FNFRFILQANRVQMEMVLLLFSLLTLYTFVRWLKTKKSIWLTLIYISIGLEILTKGFVGFIPSIITIFLLTLLSTSVRLKDLHLGRGLVIISGIVGAWLIPAFISQYGLGDVRGLFENSVSRFFTEQSKHGLFYYFQVVPLEFMPWTLLLIPAVIDRWRAAKEEGDFNSRFWLVWFFVNFVFFTLNAKRHSHYVLLMVPSLGLLLAHWFDARFQTPLWKKTIKIAGLIPLTGLAIALIFYHFFPSFLNGTKDAWAIDVIKSLISPSLILILIIFTLALFWSVYRKKGIWVQGMYLFSLAMPTIIIWYLNGPTMKVIDPMKSGEPARQTLQQVTQWQSEPVGSFGDLNSLESTFGWLYFYSPNTPTPLHYVNLHHNLDAASEWIKKENHRLILFERDLPLLKSKIENFQIEVTLLFPTRDNLLVLSKKP
ncbi:MAG TPA: glycosyltransferase family 39 protein, partial [Bdellovibrionota bacterium]|nr:glycosyltransferase family 39 protein [Bdellovibrionota bacterium]